MTVTVPELRRGALTHGGERFPTLEAGPPGGPPALFLHGYPDVPGTWAGVLERFAAAGHHGVAPFLRGYAPAPLGPSVSLEQLTADVVAHAEALGGDVVLLGHDWGAVVAYRALAEAPGPFRAAITVAVPHPLAFLANLARCPAQLARSAYMARYQLPGAARRLAARDFAEVDALYRAWSPTFEAPAAHRREVKDTLRASLPAPLAYYRGLLRPVGPAIARIRRAARQRIDRPVLHLHGAIDGCIAPGLGAGQERHFAPGRLTSEVLEGVGHFAPLEAPDLVAERALRFLSACS